jgi:predicted HicB family RNase H-like nuclease
MGVEARENKRRQSVAGAMISEAHLPEEHTDWQNIITEKAETRSKRINLLITPSVYAEAQKKCEKLGISLNECINQFLNNWTKI